jgi:hypothetical protein
VDRLTAAAAERRLVAFVGAGVLTIAPTCLPSWWEVNEQVAAALAEEVGGLIGTERAAELAGLVSARQRSDRFPPEYQAELLCGRLKDPTAEAPRESGAHPTADSRWTARGSGRVRRVAHLADCCALDTSNSRTGETRAGAM